MHEPRLLVHRAIQHGKAKAERCHDDTQTRLAGKEKDDDPCIPRKEHKRVVPADNQGKRQQEQQHAQERVAGELGRCR